MRDFRSPAPSPGPSQRSGPPSPTRGEGSARVSYEIRLLTSSSSPGRCLLLIVMAGLVPAISLKRARPYVPKRGRRDKPGGDDDEKPTLRRPVIWGAGGVALSLFPSLVRGNGAPGGARVLRYGTLWRASDVGPPRAYGKIRLPGPAAFEAREPSNVGPSASRRSTSRCRAFTRYRPPKARGHICGPAFGPLSRGPPHECGPRRAGMLVRI